MIKSARMRNPRKLHILGHRIGAENNPTETLLYVPHDSKFVGKKVRQLEKRFGIRIKVITPGGFLSKTVIPEAPAHVEGSIARVRQFRNRLLHEAK